MTSKILLILICVVGASIYYFSENNHKSGKDIAHWYDSLPPCPCQNPDLDSIKLNDGWAKDEGNLKKYHKGAKESFRSYPAIKTSAGKSCQQCCYDSIGKLITEGSGAGTPDKVSTCDGENSKGKMKIKYFSLLSHYFKDVRPWEKNGGEDSGWKKYNLLWVPNKGDNCY